MLKKCNLCQNNLSVNSIHILYINSLICLWHDNSTAKAFYNRTSLYIFYGRTSLRVVVVERHTPFSTSVCDGARVRHRRPIGPGPTLLDSRIFTDRTRHGGCRAGSVTEGRPGLAGHPPRLWQSPTYESCVCLAGEGGGGGGGSLTSE